MADPALLYLTLLLHDIGKSRRHRGATPTAECRLALPIMERLGRLAGSDANSFRRSLIKNHLAMARFWQKRDVDDPEAASSFAEPGRERRSNSANLYVHTFCDARGTAISPLEQLQGYPARRAFIARPSERLSLGERHPCQLRKKKANDSTGPHRPPRSPASAPTKSPPTSACTAGTLFHPDRCR